MATYTTEVPTGTINGVNTAFTLANTPNPTNSLLVYVGASATTLDLNTAWTLSGNVITFTTAPAGGSQILCSYFYAGQTTTVTGSTYTPQDAIALAQRFIHGIPVTDIGPQICDIVNGLIWRAFYWRWSLKAFTAVNLANATQDYPSSLPTDFYRFKMLRVVQTNISPNEFREMDEKKYIPVDQTLLGGLDQIKIYSIIGEVSGIRVARAPSISSPNTFQLQGEYQYQPSKITNGNLQTAFLFPDQYFDVMVQGMYWKFYQFADDPRAGEMQVDRYGNVIAATGQCGIFYQALKEMQDKEDMGSGQEQMFPSDPLGYTRQSNPGIFGY